MVSDRRDLAAGWLDCRRGCLADAFPEMSQAMTASDPATGRTDRDGEGNDGVADPAASPTPLPCVEFEQLARGQRAVLVIYRGQQYRLTATRTGKLLLNK